MTAEPVVTPLEARIGGPEPKAENVGEALARVMRDLPSIGKDGQASQQQGGYRYRGIEAIVRHAAPLLAKHGVVFVPQVSAVEVRDVTVGGKPWTDTILTVDYRICGPGGPEDFVTATVVGIGRDNSDKGSNKALTQAFKYALIQTLCIADEKDDTDGITYEADHGPEPDDSGEAWKAAVADLNARVAASPPDVRDTFSAWKSDQNIPWPWPAAAIEAMNAHLDALLAEHGARSDGSEGADAGGSPTAPVEDRPPSGPDEPSGYDVWTNDELVGEIKKRNGEHAERAQMPVSGNKDKLVRELRAWDAAFGCPWDSEMDAPPW